MDSVGGPGALLPLVIALELGGGIAIVLGLFTRPIALLIAGFSIASALLFHSASDQVNQIMLMKDFAIAGGFLFLVAHRSEEHTSELQSLMRISYAVFCLKKNKNIFHNSI